MSKQTVYVVILSDPYAEHLIAVFDSNESASAWVAGARKDMATDERYVIIPMPIVHWPNN